LSCRRRPQCRPSSAAPRFIRSSRRRCRGRARQRLPHAGRPTRWSLPPTPWRCREMPPLRRSPR